MDTSSVQIELSGKAHAIRDVRCLAFPRVSCTRDVFKLNSEKQAGSYNEEYFHLSVLGKSSNCLP